jgi:ribose transport system substrate-binding protein
MKAWLRVIVSVLIVFCFCSVSSMAAGKVKVGFIATNFASETQARVANSFEKLAKEKGWDVVLLNSTGSIETQANQLENLVQMKVDAVVLAMSHPAEIRPSLDKAIKAGIPVLTIDSGYVDGVVADITADNFVMGAKISTYLLDSLGGEGNIVVFKFEKHFGTRRRGKVLDQVISEYPGINVLAEHTVVGTKNFMEDTRSAMETFALRYGDQIDAVWCAFDQLAYAVSDVLQGHDLKDVIVVGVDGNDETFRRINAGTIAATVAQPFEEMSRKAVELVEYMVVKGMKPEEATSRKIIYMDAPLIDKANLPK